MLGLFNTKPSTCAMDARDVTFHFLVPENAGLAQALLEIILNHACLERWSPDGGGVAIMVLEQWQIDILFGFGVIFREDEIKPPSTIEQLVECTINHRSEYISVPDNVPEFQRVNAQSSISHAEQLEEDILEEWLRREGYDE